MIHQEWIVQQIQMLTQFIAKLFFGKDFIEYQIADFENLSETDRLFNKMNDLLKKNKICEAENLLFDSIDTSNRIYLELAVDFYERINRWNDAELEGANFSWDEVYSGLVDIMQKFGIPNITQT